MSLSTPHRHPLRVIKITTDEPSIFITRRDPTKTPKHPHLSLPPPSPYSANAPSSSPSRHSLKTTLDYISPSRKRKERSESVVCLSSPLAGSSKTRPGSSHKSSDKASAPGTVSKVAPPRRTLDVDDSDNDVIPPLSEALLLSSDAGSSRSRNMKEGIRGLRDTARDWIEEDVRTSRKKKETDIRVARLAELQARRRKPLVSPSTSPSPTPASPSRHVRARGSSVGMVETSDSVTQPTTPYEFPQHSPRRPIARTPWFTSPIWSPVVYTKGKEQMWPVHENLEQPMATGDVPMEDDVGEPSGEDHGPTAVQKGKGKATLEDLFDDEADEDHHRVQSPVVAPKCMVADDDEDIVQLADDSDEQEEIDELEDDDAFENGRGSVGGGDGSGSDEYDDDDLDDALANVDPDSFSPSGSGPSRKALTSTDREMDIDQSIPAPAGENLPLTQFDLSGVDLFTDDYDLPFLPALEDDDGSLDSGGIPSPIVLIHEMSEQDQEFFNEHWRRGADGAKRRFAMPDPQEASGSREGTRGKARSGGTTRKKSWPTRGRGKWRGRGRGGAKRK